MGTELASGSSSVSCVLALVWRGHSGVAELGCSGFDQAHASTRREKALEQV